MASWDREHWAADRQRADARADPDRATEQSAGGKHSQLDDGPDDPNGVPTSGRPGATPAR
jgi:hypothetical protein